MHPTEYMQHKRQPSCRAGGATKAGPCEENTGRDKWQTPPCRAWGVTNQSAHPAEAGAPQTRQASIPRGAACRAVQSTAEIQAQALPYCIANNAHAHARREKLPVMSHSASTAPRTAGGTGSQQTQEQSTSVHVRGISQTIQSVSPPAACPARFPGCP
jgi:hypothetical protein